MTAVAFIQAEFDRSMPLSDLYVGGHKLDITGFSSEIGTKLRDWAVGQAGGSFYSRAALSSNDSKTLYRDLPYSVQT